MREHQKVSVTVSDTEDPLASMIDYTFVESARREIQQADHIPSLEEVRAILSRIPGSLAADIGDPGRAAGRRRNQPLPPWLDALFDHLTHLPTHQGGLGALLSIQASPLPLNHRAGRSYEY